MRVGSRQARAQAQSDPEFAIRAEQFPRGSVVVGAPVTYEFRVTNLSATPCGQATHLLITSSRGRGWPIRVNAEGATCATYVSENEAGYQCTRPRFGAMNNWHGTVTVAFLTPSTGLGHPVNFYAYTDIGTGAHDFRRIGRGTQVETVVTNDAAPGLEIRWSPGPPGATGTARFFPVGIAVENKTATPQNITVSIFYSPRPFINAAGQARFGGRARIVAGWAEPILGTLVTTVTVPPNESRTAVGAQIAFTFANGLPDEGYVWATAQAVGVQNLARSTDAVTVTINR